MATQNIEDLLLESHPVLSDRSSKIERLLRSTILPTDRGFISQFLHDAEKEANRLRVAIMSLESRRMRLEETMQKCRSLLSPIHKLPPEVLAHVFTMCGQEGEALQPTCIPTAMAVSRVCGRWRDIALSTPLLWNSFRVNFFVWIDKGFDKLAVLIRTFLDRSKNSLLDLDLAINVTDDGRDNADINAVLDILAAQSARWRYLDLICCPWVWEESPLNTIKGRLPELRHLELSAPWEIDNPTDEVIDTHLFDDCPNLQSVVLRPTESDSLSDIHLPWAQIRSVELDYYYDTSSVYSLISQCSNLERLHLSSTPASERDVLENIMWDTPLLKHLSISVSPWGRLSDILQRFSAPSLLSLEMSCRCKGFGRKKLQEWDSLCIKEFLLQASNGITSLKVENLPISDSNLASLLCFMPQLEQLCIIERVEEECWKDKLISPAFLNRFTASPDFLPRLSRVDFTVNSTVPQEALLHMLASRCIPHNSQMSNICKLRSVSVAIRKDVPSGLRFSLEAFRDVGVYMSVKVTHPRL